MLSVHLTPALTHLFDHWLHNKRRRVTPNRAYSDLTCSVEIPEKVYNILSGTNYDKKNKMEA